MFSNWRGLAPLGLSLAVGALLLVQVIRPGTAGLTGQETTANAPRTGPCRSLTTGPGPDILATPSRLPPDAGAKIAMTSALAVIARDDSPSLLDSSLDIEAPNRPAEGDTREVIDLLTAYLQPATTFSPTPEPANPSLPAREPDDDPRWAPLYALLQVADPENPRDIGLYKPGLSFDIQKTTAADAAGRPDPVAIENATQVTISGLPIETPTPAVPGSLSVTSTGVGATMVDGGLDPSSASPASAAAAPIAPTLDKSEAIVDGILGPPTIYATADRVFVHVAQAERPLEGESTSLGGWIVKPLNSGVHISIRAQPANVVWNVELCVDGMQVVSVFPPPDSMGPNYLRWSFPAHPFGPHYEIQVAAEPKRATWFRQWINTGSRATLVLSWGLFLPAALLLLGLWSSRPSGPVAPEVREARARLITMSTAVVKLATAGILMLLIGALFLKDPFPGNGNGWWEASLFAASGAIICIGLIDATVWHGARRGELTRQAIPALAFIAFIFGILAFARLATDFAGWRPIWVPLQQSLLVAGYLTFLAAAFRLWEAPAAPSQAPLKRWFLLVMGVVGLLLCAHSVFGITPRKTPPFPSLLDDSVAVVAPLWVTICVILGAALLAWALLPTQITHRRIAGAGRIHAFSAIVVVLAAILVRWAMTLYSRQTFPDRARVAADPGQLVDVYSREMQDEFIAYLEAFLGPTLNLLPLLGLAGLAGMLGIAAWSDSGLPYRTDHSWIRRVVEFMFAAFVVGYGGAVVGLRAPIAFFVGLILLPLAVRGTRYFAADPNASLLTTIRSSLESAFRKTASRFTRRGQSAASAERHTAPKMNPVRCDASHDPCKALVVLEDWWLNGARATRMGCWLAIAPVSFFIYVFLNDPISGALSSSSPFAIAVFVSNVAYEAAFWLVAAFVFGFLFPYLKGSTGLTKGLALASVYVGANAIAALVGAPGDALWQVRSFQLILFLILLGLWIDLESQEYKEHALADMKKLYGLTSAIDWLRPVLPLASALAMVAYQIYSHRTAGAITELISGQSQSELLTYACWAAGNAKC